jgi:hypothetical protein
MGAGITIKALMGIRATLRKGANSRGSCHKGHLSITSFLREGNVGGNGRGNSIKSQELVP